MSTICKNDLSASDEQSRLLAYLPVFCLVLCLFLGASFGPRPAFGQTLELGNLVLDNQQGEITVRFGVRLDELASLQDVLESGSPVILQSRGSVSGIKTLWFDDTVAEAQWESELRYDALGKRYVMQLPGSSEKLEDVSLARILQKGWGRVSLVLGPWKTLQPGTDYRLDLQIRMKREDVPAWLKYVVFFKSWDVYPLANYQLDFSY